MDRWPKATGSWRMGTLLLGVLLVGAALLTAASGGVARAQAQSKTIDSCTTIDSPGSYTLGNDLQTSASETCISITASNVNLDGAGHTVSGPKPRKGLGIVVNGSSGSARGVTVENVKTSDLRIGIYYRHATGGRITHSVVATSTEGIALAGSHGVTIDNNTAIDNVALGIALADDSTDNVIRDNAATGNKWGIHFERSANHNTVVDNAAWDNSKWDYYSTRKAGNNPTRNLTIGSARLDLEVRNTGIKSVNSPPASPDGQKSLGRYLKLVHTNGPGKTISLSMYYGTGVGGDTKPAIWEYDGGSWSKLGNQQVDRSNQTVSVSNVAGDGPYILGVFAPGEQTAQPTVAPEPLPSANATLTPTAPPATPTIMPTTEATATPTTAPTTTTQATAPPTTQTTAPPTTQATATGSTTRTTTAQAMTTATRTPTTTATRTPTTTATRTPTTTATRTPTTTTPATPTTTGTTESAPAQTDAGDTPGTVSGASTTSTGNGPGFGPGIAVLGALVVAALGVLRTRQ